MSTDCPHPTPASHVPRLRLLILGIMAVIVVVEGYVAIFLKDNDFVVYREMGAAFLQGNPYGNAQDIYPVARGMINALLAIGPYRLTRSVSYLLAVAALGGCWFLWRRQARVQQPTTPCIDAAAGLGTVLLTFPLLLRDLDECGMQTFLLFFLSFGGWCLAAGRIRQAGFWLATGAVYKVTPALFLPFLLWKRQWRAAVWMAVFIVAWSLAPALWLGAETTLRSHQTWWTTCTHIGLARQAYPSQLERERPRVINLSFNAAVARYLETYPPGHPLYLDHPAFVQFGDLEPLTAFYVVRGALVVLGLLLAWRCRKRWTTQDGQPDLAAEWAAACILCAILSPVCWKQHLVLIAPAVFLAVRSVLAGGPWVVWRSTALGAIGGVILLSREFVVGKAMTLVLQSYKLDTFAVLLLLLVVLTMPRRASAAATKALPVADLSRAA
jgi:hypothetical protein